MKPAIRLFCFFFDHVYKNNFHNLKQGNLALADSSPRLYVTLIFFHGVQLLNGQAAAGAESCLPAESITHACSGPKGAAAPLPVMCNTLNRSAASQSTLQR